MKKVIMAFIILAITAGILFSGTNGESSINIFEMSLQKDLDCVYAKFPAKTLVICSFDK